MRLEAVEEPDGDSSAGSALDVARVRLESGCLMPLLSPETESALWLLDAESRSLSIEQLNAGNSVGRENQKSQSHAV
ncbi:hypothetical protein INT43_000519 [Umbelopsis isabellina]|uniref:Uncharacterized protein n=1 Tax=Mortierella isabellina TaxID=91625 RepID=A0A8H7UIR0_MORIS|nr:hypothetical protein INT43_000519 [Umbelopsis isabellina]